MFYCYAIFVNSSVKTALMPTFLVTLFLFAVVFYYLSHKKITKNMSVTQLFNSLSFNFDVTQFCIYISLNLLQGGILSFTLKHSIVHHGPLAMLAFLIALFVSTLLCICICINIILHFYPKLSIIGHISYILNELSLLVVIIGILLTAVVFIFSMMSGPLLLDSPVGGSLRSYAKNYFCYLESLSGNGSIQPTSITLSQLMGLLEKGYTINGHVLSGNPLMSRMYILGQLQRLPYRYAGTDPIVLRFCTAILTPSNQHNNIIIYSTTNGHNSVGSKILDALVDAGI